MGGLVSRSSSQIISSSLEVLIGFKQIHEGDQCLLKGEKKPTKEQWILNYTVGSIEYTHSVEWQ